MIVELFGCPGCGKTYLVESLSGNGAYKNITASYGVRKQIKNLGKKILTISPYAFAVRREITKNIDIPLNHEGQYTHRTIRKSVRNISMLAAVYKYMNRDMYIDEGIVHRVISLCVDHNMTKEKASDIVTSLHRELKPVKIYYLDTSPEVCYESIVNRGRKQAGIDFLNEKEVIDMLDKYYEFCEFICDKFDFKRISRDNKGELE